MWFTNKGRKSSKIQQLMERDAQLQAERAERLKASGHAWQDTGTATPPDNPADDSTQALRSGRMIRPRPHARPTSDARNH